MFYGPRDFLLSAGDLPGRRSSIQAFQGVTDIQAVQDKCIQRFAEYCNRGGQEQGAAAAFLNVHNISPDAGCEPLYVQRGKCRAAGCF